MLNWVLTVVLFATAFWFLCIAPYTKVEESFNMQAIHDIVFYGVDDTEAFDHIEFPGAVKRTFLGALLLALPLTLLPESLVDKFDPLLELLGNTPFADAYRVTWLNYQFWARLLLGLFNCYALNRIKSIITKDCSKNSKTVGTWFAALQFVQFHVVYYSTRTLPNFIALPFVNIALGSFIDGDTVRSLGLLCFAGIVFRVEVLFFAGILGALALYRRQVALKPLFISGYLGLFGGALLSYKLDSYFWGTSTLPELDSFVYNVIEGKSQDWGTEPFYAYFTKYLPRIFMIPVVPLFAVPGLKIDLVNFHVGTMQTVSIASIIYVCLMSLQPHKEWRFIVYSIPGITMSAASAIAHYTESAQFSAPSYKVLLGLACLGNYLLALFSGYASSFNYPGGVALSDLNTKIHSENSGGIYLPIAIHSDVAACMSGVTLFDRLRDPNNTLPLTYDKTENETVLSTKWDTFNYVITVNDTDNGDTLVNPTNCRWVKIDAVTGLHGLDKHAIVNIVKHPQKLLANLRYSIERLDSRYLKDILSSLLNLSPSMYVYEKDCGASSVEF